MKKSILFFAVGIATSSLLLSSCGNGDKQTTTNAITKKVQQVSEKKVPDLLTQQGFEKMMKSYSVSLYPNIKFKEIKETNDGDIRIVYTISDASDESHKKVQDYIKNELLKLEKNGWHISTPAAHLAMKKDGNRKIVIQINETFYKPSKLHELSISFGTIE